MVLVRKYPHYEGHADVPLSGPIEILILAPFAPIKEVFNGFNISQIVIFCFAFIFFYFLLGKLTSY